MSNNCCKKFNSDFSISTTGYAGPSVGKNKLSLGTVFQSLWRISYFVSIKKILIQIYNARILYRRLNAALSITPFFKHAELSWRQTDFQPLVIRYFLSVLKRGIGLIYVWWQFLAFHNLIYNFYYISKIIRRWCKILLSIRMQSK